MGDSHIAGHHLDTSAESQRRIVLHTCGHRRWWSGWASFGWMPLLVAFLTACPSKEAGEGAAPRAKTADEAKSEGTSEAAEEKEPAVIGGGTVDEAACKKAGGKCVAVSACSPDEGHLSDAGCGVPHMACCIQPAGSCGGPEDFICCQDGSGKRPTCTDGKLTCGEGAEKVSGTSCPS